MTIRRELIDELMKDYPNPQDVLAEDGLLKQLTKAVIERCLETELDNHLGYPKHGRQEQHSIVSFNSSVLTERGKICQEDTGMQHQHLTHLVDHKREEFG